jgi:hypothetical protein
MFKKNLISPQIYVKITDKSDYFSLTSTRSNSGGGSGNISVGGGGFGNSGDALQEISNSCTAIPYSQGFDPFVTYCYDIVSVGEFLRRSPYVECNYML